MKFWLLKTEPDEWSWKDQINSGEKGADWGGVKNYQASNCLKKMKLGDKCFFYHTGKEKRIVGIVEVIKENFLDKTDKTGKFCSISVKASKPLKKPVNLKEIKKNKAFGHLPLIRQSRLSVMEIDLKSWKKICKIGKI